MKIEDIEQTLPKQPNFGLIVALFVGAVLLIFAVALIFLRIDSGHLTFRHHDAHPTSQLLPAPLSTRPPITLS